MLMMIAMCEGGLHRQVVLGFHVHGILQNAFEAAVLAWLARIPARIGYDRDGRGLLLTQAVAVPAASEIPRHERFYYLELLRRAGWIDDLPEGSPARHDVGVKFVTIHPEDHERLKTVLEPERA